MDIRIVSRNRQIIVAATTLVIAALIVIGSKLVAKHHNSPVLTTDVNNNSERETVVERDVEVNYLEPFLRRLGFARADWTRQLPVRVGRGHLKFPDYALLVQNDGDNVRAEYIWEAKYSIPTEHQLKIDFGQARSYALLLQSRALGLVSKEGIWYTTKEEGFDFQKLRHFTWEELTDDNNFAQVKSTFVK